MRAHEIFAAAAPGEADDRQAAGEGFKHHGWERVLPRRQEHGVRCVQIARDRFGESNMPEVGRVAAGEKPMVHRLMDPSNPQKNELGIAFGRELGRL